jgi:DNA-damage-inducible protein D
MTTHNVRQEDLKGEAAVTHEHVHNNNSVRDMLGRRGIKPEEDTKKLERQVKAEEKKFEKQSGKLPRPKDGN